MKNTGVQEVPLSGVERRVAIFNNLLRESRLDIRSVAYLITEAAKSAGPKQLLIIEESEKRLRAIQGDGSFACSVSQDEWNVILATLASAVQRAADEQQSWLDESDDDAIRHHCSSILKGSLTLGGRKHTDIARQLETSLGGFGMRISTERAEKMLGAVIAEKTTLNTLEWGCIVTIVLPPAVRFLQGTVNQQTRPGLQAIGAAVSGAVEIAGGEVKAIAQRIATLSRCFLVKFDSEAEAVKVISNIDAQHSMNDEEWLIFKTALLVPAITILLKELQRVFGDSESKLLRDRWCLV